MMKRYTLYACVLLLLAAPMLSACNMVEGAGQDIQAGGRGIEKGAQKAK
jgi:entericidin B